MSADESPPASGPGDTGVTPDGVLTRRAALKTGAATLAAGGVLAAGGTDALPEPLDPIDDAEAAGPLLVAGALVAAGAIGGYTLSEWMPDDGADVDPDGVLEDQLYSAATSSSEGRAQFESQMTSEFVDRPTNQTPYANQAWQAVRSTTTEEVVNGETTTAAETAAVDALNKQTTRAVVNAVERWNGVIDSLIEQLTIDAEENVGVFQAGDSDWTLTSASPSPGENWSPVDASKIDGADEYMVFQQELTLPGDVTELDGRDDPLTLYGLAVNYNSTARIIAPDSSGDLVPGTSAGNGHQSIEATHSDLGTKTVMSTDLYSQVLGAIQSGYDSITSDLSTYVTNLANGLEQGSIDPSSILSSQDIVEEFANSDEQSRLAAEMMAMGGQVPEDAGYQALISHDDLSSDELWCWLYPRFSGDPVAISPGTTLAPEDYDIAYIGYQGEASGEFQTQVLSGDTQLEIHDTTGIEDEETFDPTENDSVPDSANESGRIVIWNGDDPPDPIQYPADHSGYHVVVVGSANRSTHPVSAVQYDSDNGEYYIAGSDSSLSAGEGVEELIITPSANYTQPVTHVADPTNVDSEQTVQELQELRETVDDLNEAFNSGGAGGGLGSLPTLPDWIPGSGLAQYAVVGVGGLAGIKLVDASTS